LTQQFINIGVSPNDGTGDQLRVSFDKCNQNFTELYTTGAASATEGIWNFNQTSIDTTTAPASGRFRTNSGNAATATQFAIHRISINGFDRADTLRTQHVGDIIKLQDKTNADSWARFIVQAASIDNVDWFQINVAFDSGGGTPPGNNQEILFTFAASSGGGGGGITDAPSDGITYGRKNATWSDISIGLAPLASPIFTGDPKAPTPATADNDTSIATTAFVKAQGYVTGGPFQPLDGDLTAIAALTGTNTIYYRSAADTWSPVTISTGLSFTGGALACTVTSGGNVSNVGTPVNGQLAQWTDATHIQGIATSSLGFAPLASPIFTGDPQAPTPATVDNDTSIATTAFVKAQSYLTGNQTVTLSGDISGAGATAITTTIANNAVTNAKLADIATARLRGRVTAGTGDPEDLTGTQATTLLDVVTSSLKGLAPASGGGTANFLRADATWAAPASGVAISIQKFIASGTYTPTAGLAYAIVECVGGGGAGGGVSGNNATYVSFGGGGGGGGYSRKLLAAAAIGASQTVTIGAGGAGSSGANGGNGGDTSLGSLCIAKGGSGGAVNASSSLGAGGSTTGAVGDVVSAGGAGSGGGFAPIASSIILCGEGGSSPLGGGAIRPVSTGAVGIAGGNYGAGGSGASANNETATRAGGNGSAGIVVVTEYK
jgi:hypothetical protein